MSKRKLKVTVDQSLCERVTIASSDRIEVWRYASGGNMLTLADARAKQPTTEREDLLIEIIESLAATLKRGDL